ncbi:hypothetical protein DIPPA_11576 [Diplonema papillatum]|nr:hypothetical protein DIPPA_11576 [Diplonema papillatum]|eukprot:gene13179-20352_t
MPDSPSRVFWMGDLKTVSSEVQQPRIMSCKESEEKRRRRGQKISKWQTLIAKEARDVDDFAANHIIKRRPSQEGLLVPTPSSTSLPNERTNSGLARKAAARPTTNGNGHPPAGEAEPMEKEVAKEESAEKDSKEAGKELEEEDEY